MPERKLELLDASKKDYNSMVELLAYLNKEKIRRSDLVVEYGEELIHRHKHRLGSEVWGVYEQTFIASLDVGNESLAKLCLKALQSKFPGSSRVRRLEGMHLESRGEYDKANDIYKEILEKNPANSLIIKRQICISKAKRDTTDTISKLNAYLKTFQTDYSAWQELAELYISRSNYRRAAFCYEELLLSNPLNFLYHTRLAEIYTTLGGIENLTAARGHFIHSIELNKRQNLRAYLGLMMCTKSIALSKLSKSDKESLPISLRIHSKAVEGVKQVYARQSGNDSDEMASYVQKVLASEEALMASVS